ncbi:MAG: tetratricopeptide repeat protein [Cyanobacteriota bacterium SKYGB_h_bin112]|nr:tetratricopeptide repeat protein [Cyanobacteriota bacterium SKYGB_h_bin112]
MIVRNEAPRLAACLRSVQGFVDVLVFVDTGSEDETIAIAHQFGARVRSIPWEHDFAAARNVSLAEAQGDWILVLDADETLVTTIVPTLQHLTHQPDVLLVNLLRQEVGAAQAPYSLVSRLFRNRPEVRFSRPYHELVDDSITAILRQEPHWRIIDLPEVAILHEGYQADAIARCHKVERARTTLEIALKAYPEDAYLHSKLGALYVQMGDVTQGLSLLERGLTLNPEESPVRYELHYHLGIAYERVPDVHKALEHYNQAIQQPLLPWLKLGAYNNLGLLLQTQGDILGASQVYTAMVEALPNAAIAHFNLAITLKALGNFTGALEHYQRAIALDPTYVSAYRNLGVLLFKLGRVTESRAAFQQAIALYEAQQSPEATHLRQALAELGLYL